MKHSQIMKFASDELIRLLAVFSLSLLVELQNPHKYLIRVVNFLPNTRLPPFGNAPPPINRIAKKVIFPPRGQRYGSEIEY